MAGMAPPVGMTKSGPLAAQSSRASQGTKARVQGRRQNPRQPAPPQDRGRYRRAVIEHTDGTELQVDVVGLDLTALIDTRQVVKE